MLFWCFAARGHLACDRVCCCFWCCCCSVSPRPLLIPPHTVLLCRAEMDENNSAPHRHPSSTQRLGSQPFFASRFSRWLFGSGFEERIGARPTLCIQSLDGSSFGACRLPKIHLVSFCALLSCTLCPTGLNQSDRQHIVTTSQPTILGPDRINASTPKTSPPLFIIKNLLRLQLDLSPPSSIGSHTRNYFGNVHQAKIAQRRFTIARTPLLSRSHWLSRLHPSVL